jgi:hypothetical protein
MRDIRQPSNVVNGPALKGSGPCGTRSVAKLG